MDADQSSSGSKRPFGLSFPSRPKSNLTTLGKLPVVNKNCPAAAAFSFGDDDDDEIGKNEPASKKKMSTLNAKDRRAIEQALEEDPNIYDYDNVYEEVSSTVQHKQKQEEKRRLERETNTVRKPKYVTGLLEKSKEREKDFERVLERKIQRERELEGDLYADKEVFVTASYKLKLAERQADLEREKFEEKREAMLSVSRQDNLDAFYRFQFKLRTGDAVILEESEKTTTTFNSSNQTARHLRRRDEDEEEEEEATTTTNNDEMYARAREKQPKTVGTEPIEEEEKIEIEPIRPPSKPVKVRRVNDETSKTFDDEQIEMGVGAAGRKKKSSTKENQMESAMPLAAEKKRIEQETRIERVRRLCVKRTVGELFEKAKEAFYQRQERRAVFKDYIERAE